MFKIINGPNCTVAIIDKKIYFAGEIYCGTNIIFFESFTLLDNAFPFVLDKKIFKPAEYPIDALVLHNCFFILGSAGTLLLARQIDYYPPSKKKIYFKVIDPALSIQVPNQKLVGRAHHMFILDSNNLYGYVDPAIKEPQATSWIGNTQLSTAIKLEVVPIDTKAVRMVTAGLDFSVLLYENGNIATCGTNQKGALGLGDCKFAPNVTNVRIHWHIATEKAIKVVAGNWHFLVLGSAGNLLGGGANEKNQLGTLDNNCRSLLEPLIIRDLTLGEQIVDIACGAHCSVALSNLGNVYICGDYVGRKLHSWQKIALPRTYPQVISLITGGSYVILLPKEPISILLVVGQQSVTQSCTSVLATMFWCLPSLPASTSYKCYLL